jgi:hypothetical protein
MIVLLNTTVSFSIDFTNTSYQSGSPYRLLGFDKKTIQSNTSNYIYGNSIEPYLCTKSDIITNDPLLVTNQSILSKYDYTLNDEPNFLIMKL